MTEKRCARCGHLKQDHGDALFGFKCPNDCEKSCLSYVPSEGGQPTTIFNSSSPPEAQLGRALALRPRSSRRPCVSRGPFGRRYNP